MTGFGATLRTRGPSQPGKRSRLWALACARAEAFFLPSSPRKRGPRGRRAPVFLGPGYFAGAKFRDDGIWRVLAHARTFSAKETVPAMGPRVREGGGFFPPVIPAKAGIQRPQSSVVSGMTGFGASLRTRGPSRPKKRSRLWALAFARARGSRPQRLHHKPIIVQAAN